MAKFTIEKKVGATVRFLQHFWVIRDEDGHRIYLGFDEELAKKYLGRLVSENKTPRKKRKPKPRKKLKPKAKNRRKK